MTDSNRDREEGCCYALSGVKCANGGAGTRQEYHAEKPIKSYRFGIPQPDYIVIQGSKLINNTTIEFFHDAQGLCGDTYSGYVWLYYTAE